VFLYDEATKRQKAEEIFRKIAAKLYAECERNKGIIPYIPQNGRYEDMGAKSINWWTNGFWNGILWQMYAATKESLYFDMARETEERLDEALANEKMLDHDVGFMWLHASVADYRLTGDETAKGRALKAAEHLASRYRPGGKFILAWNNNDPGIMIIDCLMNLPLLFWAANETGKEEYKEIALGHLETAMRYVVRPDGSCNHIVLVDPETGEFRDNPAGQGYESGSAWSRGQAWAVYGFALAYRYTKDVRYLDKAKTVAHYFLANIALNDYVSLLDFRAPAEPVYLDTTACACAACGLLEIALFVPELEKALYEQSAIRIITAMDGKYCDYDTKTDGILQYGSARYDRASDREVPIIYGDYFYLEAILRLKDQYMEMW